MKIKILALAALSSLFTMSAMAAPSSAKIGECFVIQNDQIVSKETCSITINHTKKSTDTTLKSAKITNKVVAAHNGDDYINAFFSLDGAPAEFYLRDKSSNKRIGFNKQTLKNGDAYTCYETMKKSICHS